MKQSVIILFFGLLNFFSFSQKDTIANGTIINQIDYLNANGTFTKWGELYYNVDSLYFGISGNYVCAYYGKRKVGEGAYSFNNLIASYKTEEKTVTIYYDTPIYLKLGKVSFQEFLKENTRDGLIVPKEQIRLKGKVPKFYCNRKPKKMNDTGLYRSTNRCR